MQTSVAMTDIGRKRKVNQDYVYASDLPVGNLPNLYIVADGMGGHKAGDLASSYAVQTIVESIEKSTETRPALILSLIHIWLPVLCVHSGRSGERIETLGNAGSDLSDSEMVKGACA